MLVTGGAAGLGFKMVQHLVSIGARPIVLDKDEKALKTICQKDLNITGLKCDLTSSSSVKECIDQVWKEQGAIHALINNAGVLYSAPLISIGSDGMTTHDINKWNNVININLNAVFYTTAALVSNMVKARKKGVVINISSVCASGNAGQGAYSASKAGVEALTVTWAKELGPWGIRVVGLAPGYNETLSTHSAMAENIIDAVRREIPLGRLGEPEEVVHAIMFILENDYINGVTMRLDGGLRI